MAGIFTRESNIYWSWCPSLSEHPSFISARGHFNAYILQAANDVRDQDKLVGVFERLESFFERLESYTEVPPTMDMMDTIIRIMVEVILILGIATKKIRQGRISE